MPTTNQSRITDYELLDHGIDHCQYFPGCGVCLTRYDRVDTGCGNTFAEALDDALESMSQFDIDTEDLLVRMLQDVDVLDMYQGIRATDTVPDDSENLYYYVSIRYNVE